MESHAKRKGWWSRPAKALLSLTLVASGFSSAVVTSKVHAASGTPGGSLQAPVLWLKADDGAAATNGGLTGWQDRSPNPVAFTLDLPNGAKVPQYNESGVNFNPSVKFANPANWSHYNSSAKLLGDKNITFQSGYAVYKWPEAGSAGTLVGSSDLKPSNGVIVMGGYGSDISNGPGREKVYSYASSNIRDRYQLVNYEIGDAAHTASIDGQNKNVRFQSTTFTPFTFIPVIGATNAPNSNNWTGLNAEVAEIILYETITSADAAKIETYLAVKYGITLDHDYIGTDGTLLWSKTANAAYHHNVAGLGKDILEELDQKQSRSINKDTQVAIGLGGLAEANSGNTAALADRQYLIWGDNGKPVKFTEQLGSTDWYLAQRIWKVQNNGDVGEVEIAIPASAAPGAVKLLVSDTDTDFAQATEYELSSITLANKAHYAAKVTLKDGQYFTFAAEAPELQNSLLEQIAEDGHEIVLAFDQEMTTDNLAGFIVEIGGTAVPISSLTYRVDSADSKKLILTLPEGTDVKGKTVNVSYDGTGSLKSTYGAPAKPFAVSPRDQFIDSLKITQPAGSPVNVPKPEITGEAEEGSAVAIVIRDKDGQIVTGAGGNAVVEADGTWSFTPGSDLHDGEYTVEATATKGVKSAVATKGITVNLPVPAIEITAPGGETVTDPKPEFQGTTDPGATVTAVIKDEDGKTIGTPAVTVNADGTWSFKPEAALPYGKYTVEVTSAKNGKTNMASKTITVVDKSKLQAEVDLSSTLAEEDYTPGSWTSYESKLTTAQAVLTSSTATQAEVDTALAELTAAREALVLKPVVDKSKLQAEVDVSSTLDEEDYTPGSWTNYESKLTTAQAVLTSSTATQAEVDTALAELTAAREALVLKPDKSKLQAEVNLSSTLDEEDYTTGSWTSYESKLTTAQAVLGNATATQAEVDTALAELTAAREALVLKPVVDKSKLQAEVDLSSTLAEEDYTPGSWTEYESKLTTAQAVLTSSTATQAEVDTALAELTAAREALVLKPVVDKSKLQAEVDVSSTLDEEDYTPGSWTSYESKLTTAQAVLGNATATQAEVDTALAELTTAREALVLKPDKSKLQTEVDLSSTLIEEDYTPGSWTSYESKLTTAQAVLTSSTATQAEVDTALAELTAAREALVLKPVVDKSKLQAEVDVSSTLNEEDYTPGSWTSYESKLTTAQAVLGNATATQAEVDTALAELTAAREALVLKPDKSKLQAEVDLSSTLDEEDYTPGSWTEYESKLTTAQAVLTSSPATQTEVDTALAELTAAREALVLKPDKSKLQAEVDVSSTLDEEDYTTGSWTEYEFKLTTAQAVLGNATATQAEVDTALAELTAAREALVLKPVVDKSKLQAEVDVSSTLDEEDYTPGSWTSYESKLTTAQAVLTSSTATQAEVDTALAELTAAREALVEVPVVPVVDKSKLQAEVDLSAILDKETYTPASWASYESKLTDAQAVLASATATQAEVDTALEALQAAYRALVPKSGLASITPSAGAIQPNVTASVYEYSLNVEYKVSELQLTLAAAHPDAAITVNGQAAGTGQASAAVTLNVGDNTVTIVVRETDGSEKTYTVTVRRQSAPNEPSQTPYVPSNTPTPALPVIERITVDVEAIGYGIVAKTEIERTTNNDGSKSDKVTFTTAKALEAVEKTLAAHSPSVRILIPDKQDIVKDVRVELPDAAVKAVQDAGLNLEIYTDNGMITIPNASLSGLNPNLYFHLIPVKQESERKQVEERARTEQIVRKALNNGNVYVVDRPITIETNMTSRPVTITLPLDSSHVPAEARAREAYLSKLAVFIEHSDGERELVKPAVVAYGDNKLGLTFPIGKFSTFTILNLDNGADGSHRAYMVGMPDGTFKPENALTRAQVAMILYRVLALQGADAAPYSDVSGSHWAAEAIRQVTGAGLMKGMTDGSFRPEQSITRAEMAVIIARWKALSGTGEHSYNDALGHWAEKAIGQTKEAGYMEGMLNGSFQPDKALTRAEGVTVFNRILERGPLYGETVPVWSDVPMIHWAFHQIEEASRDHNYTSRPEGGEMMIKP
ncbi:S-layer homology domain-containing protein [Paenibacillus sp. FSL H8-0122]|uniref:S-layer homology domain-containing protein n=1 Tax=Paenibacillus sp. FSL H8-0122 TaxID=2954510 RepID=UPI0030F90704